MLFHVQLIFVSWAVLAQGSPTPLHKRAISEDVRDQLSLFEQYAAAAYCPENNEPNSNAAITCSAGNCPDVEAAEPTPVLEFQGVGAGDTTGFVAVDHDHQLVVLSFRGSRSVENFVADLAAALVPWALCDGCFAHTGFLDAWDSVKSQVTDAVAQARATYPTYAVIATGHSLGGALATLAAAELRNVGAVILLYTYGSPMVGNLALASFITSQAEAGSGSNYRVTHADDIVPKLPGYLLGYAHVSPEYWVTAAAGAPVSTDDVAVSDGEVDWSGNQGTLLSSVVDHLWYFNAVAACLV